MYARNTVLSLSVAQELQSASHFDSDRNEIIDETVIF